MDPFLSVVNGHLNFILSWFLGLSQRDLALSKRAEEQLEQERRDQELAKRLQEELNMEQEPESEDARYES